MSKIFEPSYYRAGEGRLSRTESAALALARFTNALMGRNLSPNQSVKTSHFSAAQLPILLLAPGQIVAMKMVAEKESIPLRKRYSRLDFSDFVDYATSPD
jgi:hypothetical protein